MRLSSVLALTVATLAASPALASYADFDVRDDVASLYARTNEVLYPNARSDELSMGVEARDLRQSASYNHFRKLHPSRELDESLYLDLD